ncbi:MAG: hypothetical protein AAFU41_07615 [Pseudomonadota bacterium]
MKRILGMAAVIAMVAACADEEATDTTVDLGGGEVDVEGAPVVTASTASVGDIGSITYNGSDELTVTIPLAADSANTTYEAAGATNGYNRFTQQDDPLDRAYTAFAKTSTDGSITGVAISDGGQFNRFFGGARVVQNNYTAPSSGLVSYGGEYVGLLNFGEIVGGDVNAPPSAQPRGASEVSGLVLLEADFTTGDVEGVIYERTTTSAAFPELEDVVLTVTDISSDGTFTGGTEFDDVDNTPNGSYAGVFGGTNAATVGGVIDLGAGFLTPLNMDGTLGDDPGNGAENEYGVFVIDICPGGGTPATCFNTEGPNE